MISKTLGGVEQAFLDYNQTLLLAGNDVLAVADTRTKLRDKLTLQTGLSVEYIRFNRFNYLLILTLYKKLKEFRADVIITHSKKAVPILRTVANLLHIPLVGVSHNPKYKLVNRCDAIFSITQYQKNIFIRKGFPKQNIYVVPNCIGNVAPYGAKGRHRIPIIGAMGRFDPAKGFDIYLKALGILKKTNIKFRAVLGGDIQAAYPHEKEKYQRIISENHLEDCVELIGWVKSKDDFYNKTDIFVLPSYEEPFGIVLLEAMSLGVPVVSSDSEGPSEIFQNHQGSVSMFAKGDEFDLAEKLKNALRNKKETQAKAQNAWQLCRQKYTYESIAKLLDAAVRSVVKGQ
jgi:glycosyltransferase involved in cell wall biosynthesis